MNFSRQRIAFWTLIAGTAALIYAALLMLARVAHADPITNTQLSVDTAAQLLEQHGPVIGGAVLLFAFGGWFLRRFRAAEWLTKGRRFAIASAALMVLGSVLQWRVNGAPLEGIFAALVTAWGLVMRPTVAVEPTAPA